ncbi:PucR family transcriptional regulator [Heyndrickxia ginsengihumi]|uniref:PucR family transcriptional regulator n=1 Tax=Heyndrickxia ginsengihumi TaxID=363870 RepID=UPI0004722D00|nr:PucR family transcriptional regulator [Heyndrickxia ginsengihumi]
MHFTIEQFLSHPLLKEAKLLFSNKAMLTQPIESISVIETPVERLIRENEIVLTTAIGCEENDTFKSFIKAIYASHAAAIAIAIGRNVTTIPESILKFARKHEFPIILLPWKIRFSDIIKIVTEGVYKQKQYFADKADSLQRRLLQLYFEGDSLSRALKLIEDETGMQVYLLQEEFAAAFFSLNQEHPTNYLQYDQVQIDKPSVVCTIWNTRAQVFPFHIYDHYIGIIILETAMLSFELIDWFVLEKITIALRLWFKKDRILIEQENKEKTEFIKTLVEGKYNDWKKIEKQVNRFNIDKSVKYFCIVGFAEMEDCEQKYSSFESQISKIAFDCARSLRIEMISTFQSGYLSIFLNSAVSLYNEFIDVFEEKLAIYCLPYFSWGISERLTDVYAFPHNYKDAKIALEIGRRQKGPGTRNTSSDTSIFRLLSHLSENKLADDLVRQTIEPLITYNRERGLDLFRTLSYYINYQGNISQTARALALQRQSLLYRLQKIESLTGKSLSEPDDRFLLQLCQKLLTISGVQ